MKVWIAEVQDPSGVAIVHFTEPEWNDQYERWESAGFTIDACVGGLEVVLDQEFSQDPEHIDFCYQIDLGKPELATVWEPNE